MTQSDQTRPVFPREEAPDIPSSVSSLTRSDFDSVLDMLGIAPLSDWQWRVVVGLGLLRERERVAGEWRQARKAYVSPIGEVDSVYQVHHRHGGLDDHRRTDCSVEYCGLPSTDFFPTRLSDGSSTFLAADYPFGHLLSTAGPPARDYSRQTRDGVPVWVQMP